MTTTKRTRFTEICQLISERTQFDAVVYCGRWVDMNTYFVWYKGVIILRFDNHLNRWESIKSHDTERIFIIEHILAHINEPDACEEPKQEPITIDNLYA